MFGAPYEGPPGLRARRVDRAARSTRCSASPTSRPGIPGMTAPAHDPLPRPTPLFHELRFRAWVDRVEGRRIMSSGRGLGRRCTDRRGRGRVRATPSGAGPAILRGSEFRAAGRRPLTGTERNQQPKHDAGRLKLSPETRRLSRDDPVPGLLVPRAPSVGHVPAVRDDDPRPDAGRGRGRARAPSGRRSAAAAPHAQPAQRDAAAPEPGPARTRSTRPRRRRSTSSSPSARPPRRPPPRHRATSKTSCR